MSIWNWMKLQRLQRRGDVIDDWAEHAQILLDLGGDLIPGPERELPRDLYGLLIYLWAARADRTEVFDARLILRRVRTQAWLGYSDMPALLQTIRTELPRATTGQRMQDYFGQLAEARSTYLFLPVVSRIDRHQSGGGPLPVGTLRVDGLADRQKGSRHGQLARDFFVLAPAATRERDTLLLALMVLGWDKGKWKTDVDGLLTALVVQLRTLYAAPGDALGAVRADIRDPVHGAAAAEIVHAVEEISRRAPWLWLEVLFVVENWAEGAKFFDKAFEVKVIPSINDL